MRGPIYVGFSGSSGVLGRLIRWFTGGDVNHAFLLYYSEEKEGWVVLGADSGGWMETPAESLKSNQTVRLYKPPPAIDLREGMAASRTMLGAGYDVGGLIGMTWVMFCRRVFGKRVGNPFNANSKVFCSEIVDAVLDRSRVSLGLDEHAVDPALLEKALAAWQGPEGKFSGPYDLPSVLGPAYVKVVKFPQSKRPTTEDGDPPLNFGDPNNPGGGPTGGFG